MEILLIALTALLASVLTFFSGFGLGTILMPVFALFFPVDIAIALTGIVHLLNNLFKMALVGKLADWQVVLRFGLPAILGAILGAKLLLAFSDQQVLISYELLGRLCEVTPVKLLIAVVIMGFAILEFLPFYQNMAFGKNKLPFGGLASGFFGGLSGHQGALRSAFLIKCGLSKEAFIATGVIIASVVDISRLTVYFTRYSEGIDENLVIVAIAGGAAFLGAVLGKQLLKKVTIQFVQVLVSVMIMVLSVLLGAGII